MEAQEATERETAEKLRKQQVTAPISLACRQVVLSPVKADRHRPGP